MDGHSLLCPVMMLLSHPITNVLCYLCLLIFYAHICTLIYPKCSCNLCVGNFFSWCNIIYIVQFECLSCNCAVKPVIIPKHGKGAWIFGVMAETLFGYWSGRPWSSRPKSGRAAVYQSWEMDVNDIAGMFTRYSYTPVWQWYHSYYTSPRRSWGEV